MKIECSEKADKAEEAINDPGALMLVFKQISKSNQFICPLLQNIFFIIILKQKRCLS